VHTYIHVLHFDLWEELHFVIQLSVLPECMNTVFSQLYIVGGVAREESGNLPL